jgi:putative glutamine amidotransferase
MMSKHCRVLLVLFIVVSGVAGSLTLAYFTWRTRPPASGPRIGLSMASGFVVQRPLYEDALARAGGRSVLIQPTDDDQRLHRELDGVDALLLTGGVDVDPTLYQGDASQTAAANRNRDEFEIRLIRAAVERNMPILGICRGIQILNVAHDGTLRDLRQDPACAERHGIGLDSFAAHDVDIVEQTKLAGILGAGAYPVNSFHGQAVDRVGTSLVVCATADDGVIEAVERPDRTFVIGIQWHPEITSLTDEAGLALYRALVREADAYRVSRPPVAAASP